MRIEDIETKFHGVIGVDLSYTETAFVFDSDFPKSNTGIDKNFGYLRVKLPSTNLRRSYDILVDNLQNCVASLENHKLIDLVVLENYSFGSRMLTTMGELGGIFKLLLEQEEIPYILVAPTTLKKFITGDGHSKKDKILQQVYKRWGFEAPSSDVGDAFGLWKIGKAFLGENVKELTKEQTKQIIDLKKRFAG